MLKLASTMPSKEAVIDLLVTMPVPEYFLEPVAVPDAPLPPPATQKELKVTKVEDSKSKAVITSTP